jgi:heme A synthase
VFYTVFVILFGAVVRVTGSGAGCGQHWPTCNGEVVHLPRSVETVIELTHRLTSGLSLLVVLGLAFAAFRRFPRAHRVRKAALAAAALMVVEALVGAALVLLELVGTDRSVGRAIVMPAHLLATSALTATLLLTAWWARAPARSSPGSDTAKHSDSSLRRARGLVRAGVAGVLLVSATGGITALGDTVYPVKAGGLAAGVHIAHQTGAHFLEQLRIVHPAVALAVAVYLFYAAAQISGDLPNPTIRFFSRSLRAAVGVQLVAGVVNVLLAAPGAMQVVHLALSVLVWGLLVLLGATVWDEFRPALV